MRKYDELQQCADPICIEAAHSGAGDDVYLIAHLDAGQADPSTIGDHRSARLFGGARRRRKGGKQSTTTAQWWRAELSHQ